ncbi:MAG TPA: SDR family NAD(P)-dependent oxidoreductase [Thermoanaerobaculia bacterium]|nr:SDR family NAD(P)-dependent oxidoreductase [Thermoanaerobaculia bacterium]
MDTPQRVAVVTGASRGLGAAFARVLSEEGFAVALGARDVDAVEHLAGELPGPALPHPLDVADAGSVEAFRRAVAERFGRVDVLVNNAGIGIFKRLEETSAAEFEQTFRVNVQGAWAATVAFLPRLKESRGLVLMVSSDVSTRTFPTGGSYTASKFALRALSRTLQQENPELRVLELRPGAVDTWFAGSTPGAPGKDWFLQPPVVAEALRFALRLPPGARVEELVLRSSGQTPEY